MSFNLIDSPWLPVRRASGAAALIAPHRITEGIDDDPIVRLDFGRPDFEGAVTEFLIGLIAVVMAPADLGDDAEDWATFWHRPPSPDELAEKLAPLAIAFNLDGDGPRCFQDLDELSKAHTLPLRQMLIEAPGAQTERNNGDLFQKRGELPLAVHEVAAALITLQTYAPSGGKGHRTSMRGGGPLTTLVAPVRADAPGYRVSLWDRIWANVPARGTSELPSHDQWLFSWLAAARTSQRGEVTSPEAMHPWHCFFGCPRRIRLRFDSAGVPIGYGTLSYGTNYGQWIHPLSPYYQAKTESLPRHPRAGPTTYRDWLGVLAGEQAGDRPSAAIVAGNARLTWLRRETNVAPQSSINAFGYDMDNMKARGWTTQVIPFHPVPPEEDNLERFRERVRRGVEGARFAAQRTQFAAKLARFGEPDGHGGLKLRDSLPRDACQEVAYAVWTESEPAFRDLLRRIAETVQDDLPQAAYETFFLALRQSANGVLRRHIDDDALIDSFPQRLTGAWRWLYTGFSQYAKKSVWTSLGFAPLPRQTQEDAA